MAKRSFQEIPIVVLSLFFLVFWSVAQTPPGTDNDEGITSSSPTFVEECSSTCLPSPLTIQHCPPPPRSSPPPPLLKPPTFEPSPESPPTPTSVRTPPPPACVNGCAPPPPDPILPYFPWYYRFPPPPHGSSAAKNAQESVIMLSCMIMPTLFSFIF